MYQPFFVEVLGILQFKFIECIGIIGKRTYKVFIENRDGIVVHIYILVGAAQILNQAFIIQAIGNRSFDDFTGTVGLSLFVEVGKRFGQIHRQVRLAFRGGI